MITPERLKAAVKEFQSAYDGWEEYGISDDDAEDGLILALQCLGIEIPDTTRVARLKAKREKERAEREAYENRRAAMTPAQRKAEDLQIQIARNTILNRVFDSSPILTFLRGKEKP